MTTFDEVATRTREGDSIMLPGGLVTYEVERVLSGAWKGVKAMRTSLTRIGDNYSSHASSQDISAAAWGDLVKCACSASRRETA